MSGLLALLDDVAAIAKVAAASVDDVIGQATKAGSKAAGAVIDDAAVSPKYVHGLKYLSLRCTYGFKEEYFLNLKYLVCPRRMEPLDG